MYKRGGKKGAKGKKKRTNGQDMGAMNQHEMLTPRNDMEQVDEEAEDMTGMLNAGE